MRNIRLALLTMAVVISGPAFAQQQPTPAPSSIEQRLQAKLGEQAFLIEILQAQLQDTRAQLAKATADLQELRKTQPAK